VARAADSFGAAVVGNDEVEVRARLVELGSHDAIVRELETPAARTDCG
jgi:hypothetical protein